MKFLTCCKSNPPILPIKFLFLTKQRNSFTGLISTHFLKTRSYFTGVSSKFWSSQSCKIEIVTDELVESCYFIYINITLNGWVRSWRTKSELFNRRWTSADMWHWRELFNAIHAASCRIQNQQYFYDNVCGLLKNTLGELQFNLTKALPPNSAIVVAISLSISSKCGAYKNKRITAHKIK